eukprot:gene16218-17851_t
MKKSAHDLIMEANSHLFTKRSTKDGTAAENEIIKINQAAEVKLFEGDIAMTDAEIKEQYEGSKTSKRAIIKDLRNSWRTRSIPYYIGYLPVSGGSTKVKAAMAKIVAAVPCLKFRPMVYEDQSYLYFTSGNGCWANIGKKSAGATEVRLGPNCFSEGIIIHEILHALGFFHEQSRPDRDSFVTINYENIQDGQSYNFQRRIASESQVLDTLYDYKSIMHYGRTTFNNNGKDTINAKFDPAMDLGSQTLSETDILELNKIYQCHRELINIIQTHRLELNAKSSSYAQTHKLNKFDLTQCTGADSYGIKDEHRSCTSCLEPMNGHWGKWGSWGGCSNSCNKGTRSRYRSCNNPTPSNGGKACPDSSSQTMICIVKKCSHQWYDTSFETGWGMWRTQNNGGLQWRIYSGSTPTINTGPTGDHTSGSGFYAYLEAGSMYHKTTAKLYSSQLPANFGEKCLNFFYSMNGKTMGSLTVTLRFSSGTTMWLWQKTGHQGVDWKAGAVSLPKMTESYSIEFAGKIGYSPYSDIGIDDVFILDGLCERGMEICADHEQYCDSWAKTGECHKNTMWMLRSCCKSCSKSFAQCTTDSYGTQCAGWAKDSGCTQNGEWMWKNCCKSCKACMNKYGHCNFWASNGECQKNPTWMKENCKKTVISVKAALLLNYKYTIS